MQVSFDGQTGLYGDTNDPIAATQALAVIRSTLEKLKSVKI